MPQPKPYNFERGRGGAEKRPRPPAGLYCPEHPEAPLRLIGTGPAGERVWACGKRRAAHEDVGINRRESERIEAEYMARRWGPSR